MLCSHFTQDCILLFFLEAKNPYCATKNCWKSSYIWIFILSKKGRNWFHKNLHNWGMVDRRKLPSPTLKHIFNALSIGVQYTLSFQWTNFGLKCLLMLLRHLYTPTIRISWFYVCIFSFPLKCSSSSYHHVCVSYIALNVL